jgi:hypothetical protein
VAVTLATPDPLPHGVKIEMAVDSPNSHTEIINQ